MALEVSANYIFMTRIHAAIFTRAGNLVLTNSMRFQVCHSCSSILIIIVCFFQPIALPVRENIGARISALKMIYNFMNLV